MRFALLVGCLVVLSLGYPDAANATTWLAGDLTTFTQSDWGDAPNGSNAASLLDVNYATVYSSTLGLVEIGVPGAAGFSALFTGSSQVLTYLPAAGTPGPFDSDLLNPTTTAAGTFGGEVLALMLNIDFSDAGVTPHTATVHFGDLHLSGMTLAGLDGMTVRDFAATVNTLIGGGSAAYTIDELDPITGELNAAFGAGEVSQFAQDHLQAPTSVRVPEPSSLALLVLGALGLGWTRWRRH